MEEISILKAHLTQFTYLLQDRCWYLTTDLRFLNAVRCYDWLFDICANVCRGHIFLMLPFSFLLTSEDQIQVNSYFIVPECSVTTNIILLPCHLSGLKTPGQSHWFDSFCYCLRSLRTHTFSVVTAATVFLATSVLNIVTNWLRPFLAWFCCQGQSLKLKVWKTKCYSSQLLKVHRLATARWTPNLPPWFPLK